MPRASSAELSPDPGRTVTGRWPEPVAVIGCAAAVEGLVDLPPELARWVVRGPFDRASYPPAAGRAPGARALLAAVGAALADSGVEPPPPERRAVVVGTCAAAINEAAQFMREVERVGGALCNPALFPLTVINAAAGMAAIQHDCKGPNVTLNNGATSALDAVAHGADLLAAGRADLVLAGGFESVGEDLRALLGRREPAASVAVVLALVRGRRDLPRLLAYQAGRWPGLPAGEARRRTVDEALRAAGRVVAAPGGPRPPACEHARGALLELLGAVRRCRREVPGEDGEEAREAQAVVAHCHREAALAALVLAPPEPAPTSSPRT